MLERSESVSRAYAIFTSTFFHKKLPACYSEDGYPVIFSTELEAQRDIADTQLTRIQEFLDGERDYEDAIATEEYVLPVMVRADGSILTDDGHLFGKSE